MRRARPLVTIATVLIAGCSSNAAPASHEGDATLSEFRIAMQPTTLAAGPEHFTITNKGTIAHEFVIKAELPDMKRDEINVTFEQNVLTLSGERKASFEDDNGAYHRSERAHGRFTRSFTLPASADGTRISASYKDGVLTVRVPQREEAKPKQITVGVD